MLNDERIVPFTAIDTINTYFNVKYTSLVNCISRKTYFFHLLTVRIYWFATGWPIELYCNSKGVRSFYGRMNSTRANIRTDSDTSGNETFSSFGKCAPPSNRMNVRIMKWIEYAETEYATKEIPLSAEKPLNSIHMLIFTLCSYIFSPYSFCFLNCAENGCSSRCCCIPFFLFVLFCLHSLFVGIFTKEIVIDEI